jgi:hypothetical protein
METQLNKIQLVIPFLTERLTSQVKRMEEATREERPVISILATNKKLLAEFQDSLPPELAENWKINSYITEPTFEDYSEDYLKGITEDVMASDLIILLTTALRIAPTGVYTIINSIRSYRKRTFILLGELQQVPKKEEVIMRKISEAGQAFDIENVHVYACGPKSVKVSQILPISERIVHVNDIINEKLKRSKSEQTEKYVNHIYNQVFEHVMNIHKDYLQTRQSISSEKNLMMQNFKSLQLQFRNFRTDMNDLQQTFLEELGTITWNMVKGKIVEEEGEIPLNEHLFASVENALIDLYNAAITKIKDNNSLKENLTLVAHDMQKSLYRDIEALSKIPNVDVGVLKQLKELIVDDQFLQPLYSRLDNLETSLYTRIFSQYRNIIVEKTSTFKIKLFHSLRGERNINERNEGNKDNEPKDTEQELEDKQNVKSSNDAENENKHNNNSSKGNKSIWSQKYSLIKHELFEHEMESAISSISESLLELAQEKISSSKQSVIGSLEEGLESYQNQIIDLYNQLAKKHEEKFIAIKEFIK